MKRIQHTHNTHTQPEQHNFDNIEQQRFPLCDKAKKPNNKQNQQPTTTIVGEACVGAIFH